MALPNQPKCHFGKLFGCPLIRIPLGASYQNEQKLKLMQFDFATEGLVEFRKKLAPCCLFPIHENTGQHAPTIKKTTHMSALRESVPHGHSQVPNHPSPRMCLLTSPTPSNVRPLPYFCSCQSPHRSWSATTPTHRFRIPGRAVGQFTRCTHREEEHGKEAIQ